MSNRRKARGRVEGGQLVHDRNKRGLIVSSHIANGTFVSARRRHFNQRSMFLGRNRSTAGRLITACLWCGRVREVDKERICKNCRRADHKRVARAGK